MSKEKIATREEGTRVRVPFGAHRSKLQLSDIEKKAFKDEGYEVRWINDVDGRVERGLAGGWQFVKPQEARSIGSHDVAKANRDLGDKVSKVVSRGEPIILAYLMKIKEEYFEEDKASKEAVNARVDQALAGGNIGDDPENFYGEGVTFSNK